MESVDIELHTMMKQVVRISERFVALEQRPRDFGTGQPLHHAEIHTIQAIGKMPETNASKLAKHMGVTRGAISQMIAKLVAKGLVEKKRKQGNAKEMCLCLTKPGRVCYEEHERFHQQVFGVIRDYFDGDLEGHVEMLNKVMAELGEVLDIVEEIHKKPVE